MSSPLVSELTELAAPRPGFRLSAPRALAAPGAVAHARGPGSARRAWGAEAPELLFRLQSGGKRRAVPWLRRTAARFSLTLPGPICVSMASHQQSRIQAYLEKNKIGPLFEELMTKLITETPDQPIPFLIDHLQSKQGNHGQLQRTLSGSAALWAESETSGIAISDELDKETVAFNSSLLRPRVIGEWIGREENDADPLAAEMLQPPVPRSKNEQWENEDNSSSPAGSLKVEPKTKGLKQQQQQHKKLLAAMLSQDSFESLHSPTPSVTEEDIDNEDDAMELLEDLDDLRMEGVTTLVPSGSKFNQARATHPAEPQAKVTLNICSRCARLQGDNLAERTEETSQALHSPDEIVPDSLDSLPGTEEALMEEGEEFEKASKLARHGEVSSGGQSLKNYTEEDESLKQLQVVHQPWILPSDTESEGVEAEQDKRSADLLLCVPCSSCPTLVYSGMFAQGI
ncbi:uncharacterized protein C8orf34 homolog isoform X9 [Mustela putorius furo]|uniref:Uncharacterized protein C8orf34 homolog isoform X9 n=1 Tax=Mustela putorius furo TaxID=9669 RepID=A0A8U0ULF5_MUSPF|nr:uncharacterized protein C8orf34 homolog isoform X9 [Mustela putorius furo]